MKRLLCAVFATWIVCTPTSLDAMLGWLFNSDQHQKTAPAANQVPNTSTPIASPPGPNINISITPNFAVTASNENTNKTQVDTEIKNNTAVTAQNQWYTIDREQITQIAFQYKYYWIASAMACSYLYIYSVYWRGNRYLQQDSLWSSFKEEVPLHSLRSLTHAQIIDDLLHTIHSRYILEQNPLNDIQPMATFLQEIEMERKTLLYYQNFYYWATMTPFKYLLPAKKELFETIPARLQRLAFVKQVFITWACQVKLKNHLQTGVS